VSTDHTSGHRAGLKASGYRIAIVVSRFHEQITTKLLGGAQDCLREHGASEKDVEVVWCPGAFELPQVANMLAASDRWDAIICLGAVIRGETSHFEHVAGQAAHGIQTVALERQLPVAFGLLTTDTLEQAHERAGGRHGNKGRDAALAALEMVALFQRWKRK
jgi:6,7-dimethyl-8-ribityllumazine synthase